ncbi:hypothetical protein, partial [Halalkalibacter oceani]
SSAVFYAAAKERFQVKSAQQTMSQVATEVKSFTDKLYAGQTDWSLGDAVLTYQIDFDAMSNHDSPYISSVGQVGLDILAKVQELNGKYLSRDEQQSIFDDITTLFESYNKLT